MRPGRKNIPDREHFIKILKSEGLKATTQRLAVHDAMLALGHACADTVADYIEKNSETKVTVASVYNILSSLADLRIYERRMSDNNKMYFDINTTKHVHLYDTKHHEFKDIPDNDAIALVENCFKGKRFKGYKIDRIDIQIVCHATDRKKKSFIL